MTTALLVHSGGFSGRQWRKLGELLAPTHEVLAPDLLGYGVNPWPAPRPFHFRQDVEYLADLLRGQRADVVGHSYGGFLALQLALAHPELVDRIAVFDPVGFNVLTADERAAGFSGIRDRYEPDADGVDEAWLASFVDWWNGPSSWETLAPVTQAAFRAVSWKLSQEVSSLMADRESDYARIAAPTTILGAGKSPAAERQTVARLAEVIPGARLELFPDLGHMGPITAADRVNPVIAAALLSSRG
jgi:pimeloyl-ACP methyl ester carboxylesterase